MEASLLKIFVSVANHKSISLGAEALGFTQSNATLRIKQLEKNVAHPLFHRIPKGVILTKEGEKLYPYAVDIVKKVEEAELQMRNISHQELLRVGTTQANTAIRLLKFIEKTGQKFPDMQLELRTDSTPNVVADLLSYKVDIAFVTGNPQHKDIEILNQFYDDLYLVESKKDSANCLFGYRSNCGHFEYLKSYQQQLGNHDFKTTIVGDYEVILGCIKKGMGKAYLAKTIIDKYGYSNDLKLTKIKKQNDEKELETFLVCRKDYKPMVSDYLSRIKL